MSALTAQMATDLNALWTYDITATATIVLNGQTTEYTVLLDDMQSNETDAFGGPELSNTRKIHFRTTDLPDIEIGSTLTLLEPTNVAGTTIQRKKLVLESVTSADGNELIVTVRGA